MIVEYGFDRSEPIIHVFKRQGDKRVHKTFSFKPYFYVPADIDVKEHLSAMSYNLIDRVQRLPNTCALDGTKVQRIYTKSPRDVKKLRQKFDVTYEADVPFTTRYMLDKVSDKDFGDPYKVMYLDIEIDAPLGASFDNVFDYPIICMTAICDDVERVFTDKDGEKKMLDEFCSYVVTEDPDIIAGWNIDFDVAGIIERMGPDSENLSPLNYVRGGDSPKVPGRILFDLCGAYKKMMVSASKKPQSYSLNYVAFFEFEEEIEPLSRIIGQVYKEDAEKAVNYNRRHTQLCQEIDDELRLTETFTALQRLALCEFRDTRYDSTTFDRILLRRSNRVLPTKPESVEEKSEDEEYQGAVVFDPVPGLYNDVYLFDFKSLYPSAVLSLNVSPETLRLSEDESDLWLDGLGVGFVAEPRGLMPAIISDFLEERAKARAQSERKGDAFDLKQLALKINANAAYGTMGFKRFRLYNKDVAASITYAGREAIEETRRYLESLGIKVIYGDTDSVFVTGLLEARIGPEKLVELINKHIGEYFESRFGVKSSHIEIEYEDHFRSVFFGVSLSGKGAAKKRYAGLNDDGELYVKGLEVKRRDCPVFGRNLQEEVLKALLEGKEEDAIVGAVQAVHQYLIDGHFSLAEMAIPKSLSKPISAYKVADSTGNIKFAWAQAVVNTNRDFGTNYTGQEPDLAFIYLKRGIRAFLPEDEANIVLDEIDYGKLTEMAITRRVRPIFEGMKWPMERVTEGKLQKSLSEYL